MARPKHKGELLIECKKCGKTFSFTCAHRLKVDLTKHLEWAKEKVTLCYSCRPYRGKPDNSRSGMGGTDYVNWGVS